MSIPSGLWSGLPHQQLTTELNSCYELCIFFSYLFAICNWCASKIAINSYRPLGISVAKNILKTYCQTTFWDDPFFAKIIGHFPALSWYNVIPQPNLSCIKKVVVLYKSSGHQTGVFCCYLHTTNSPEAFVHDLQTPPFRCVQKWCIVLVWWSMQGCKSTTIWRVCCRTLLPTQFLFWLAQVAISCEVY